MLSGEQSSLPEEEVPNTENRFPQESVEVTTVPQVQFHCEAESFYLNFVLKNWGQSGVPCEGFQLLDNTLYYSAAAFPG